MEAKQLELFSQDNFEKNKTYILKKGYWYLIDNVKRETDYDFINSKNDREYYKLAVKIEGGQVNVEGVNVFKQYEEQARVMMSDKNSTRINIYDYFKLAQFLKFNGKYIYNKRIGEPLQKNIVSPKSS